MEKRELAALLSLSFRCLVMVVWLFLAVLWICLRFVVVVFRDHTHFFTELKLNHTWTMFNKAHSIICRVTKTRITRHGWSRVST